MSRQIAWVRRKGPPGWHPTQEYGPRRLAAYSVILQQRGFFGTVSLFPKKLYVGRQKSTSLDARACATRRACPGAIFLRPRQLYGTTYAPLPPTTPTPTHTPSLHPIFGALAATPGPALLRLALVPLACAQADRVDSKSIPPLLHKACL